MSEWEDAWTCACTHAMKVPKVKANNQQIQCEQINIDNANNVVKTELHQLVMNDHQKASS